MMSSILKAYYAGAVFLFRLIKYHELGAITMHKTTSRMTSGRPSATLVYVYVYVAHAFAYVNLY